MGWLADRAFDARVAMTTKELLWDIESASALRRAMILALAQLLRTEMFGSPNLPSAVLSQPEDFGRPGIGQYYWNLETVRNNAVAQQETLQRNLPQLGLALPQFTIDHARNTQRALELWMVTLGCAVHSKSRPETIKCWNLLRGAFDELPAAIDELERIETLNAEAAGQHGNNAGFASIDRSQWIEWCRYVPPFLAAGISAAGH